MKFVFICFSSCHLVQKRPATVHRRLSNINDKCKKLALTISVTWMRPEDSPLPPPPFLSLSLSPRGVAGEPIGNGRGTPAGSLSSTYLLPPLHTARQITPAAVLDSRELNCSSNNKTSWTANQCDGLASVWQRTIASYST